MYELPASVRLSLWLTDALRSGRDLLDAVVDALPDVDDADPAIDRLTLWRDLGERVVCVDLPTPGVLGGLLPANSEAARAAAIAGECIFVPGLGGALVPNLEMYGPHGDQGLRLTMTAYDSAPVAAYSLAALSYSEIDRRFREALLRETAHLEGLNVHPFESRNRRARADERVTSALWALPLGLNDRALRILTTAGLVTAAIDEALAVPAGVDAASSTSRDASLRRLLAESQLAISHAATCAALELAGYR